MPSTSRSPSGRVLSEAQIATEAAAIARAVADATPLKPRYPAGLSSREVEVLRLVATGLTNAQVAERLYLSPRTVYAHLHRIYAKLGIASRAEAVRFVLDHGLA